MKNMNLAGNLCMCMSMQRWSASLIKVNEFSPAGYPAGTLFVCQRAPSAEEQTEGPPPANSFLPKATVTIPTEATFESWMGAPKSQKRGEVFSCKVIALQNTNGQEANLSVWLAEDRRAMQSSCPLSKPGSQEEPTTPC